MLGALALLLLSGVSHGARGTEWISLERSLARADSVAEIARMRQDPPAVLAAETVVAQVLPACRAALRAAGTPRLAAGGAAVAALLKRMLGARDAWARDWIDENPEACARLDPQGTLRFWSALEAYERQRWRDATTRFSGEHAPWLMPYAEWLRLRALQKIDAGAAGAQALALARVSLHHAFFEQIAVMATRALLDQGDLAPAEEFLERWQRVRAPRGEERSIWLTLRAEISRRRGAREDAARFFAEGLDASARCPGVADLRVAQAQGLLESANSMSSDAIAAVIRVISELGSAPSSYAAWRRGARGLNAADSLRAAEAVFAALHRGRESDLQLSLATSLRRASVRQLRMRAALHAGRVWRRMGEKPRMEAAYREAAQVDDSSAVFSPGEAEIGGRAAWELARELEDDGEWASAAQLYGILYRRFPGDADAPESWVRQALCDRRAGRADRARARLTQLCRDAAHDRRARPCLWRALVGDPAEREALLDRAASEGNPGYFAHRAFQERSGMGGGPHPGGARADGAGCDPDSLFWAELAREARDPQSWFWPANPEALSPAAAEELHAIVDGNPMAEAGRLFLSRGYATWARDLWTHLPRWSVLTTDERAALLLALGDYGESVRMAIAGGSRRARYPVVYSAEVDEAARRFSVSPALLLALMRQESLFEAEAESGVGAQGLLQLMPETAKDVARNLGLTHYDVSDPRTNVLLGAACLSELLASADGAVPLALAGYNGGLDNARRWRAARCGWDEYVEQIGFAETRRFVRSVLMHYWFYRCCYPPPAGREANAPLPCPCN